MSSQEIAKLCGKNHKDVMRAIRNMEPAWEKTAQGRFSLGSLQRPLQPTSPTNTVGQSHCAHCAPEELAPYVARAWTMMWTKINPVNHWRLTGFIVSSLCGSEVFGSELRLLFSLFTWTFIWPSSCAKIGNNPDIAKHFLSLFLANLFWLYCRLQLGTIA